MVCQVRSGREVDFAKENKLVSSIRLQWYGLCRNLAYKLMTSAAMLGKGYIKMKLRNGSEYIESLKELKREMGLSGLSLDVKEVLNALAASSVQDKNAKICIDVLDQFRGCELHTTHLMDSGDEKPLQQLGFNVTTDAKLPFNNFNS